MKLESLVIVDQHAAVNTFPGLVHTARHTMGVGFTRRRYPNLLGCLLYTSDAEARKRGEQTGLDTLVVHAVNDEC